MKTNKKDTNGNGNGNGVATLEASNGNGTKKAEVKEQVNPVKTSVMEIIRPDEDSANKITSITVNIPIRIDTYLEADNKRYAEVVIDTLRCHASSIFEHISRLGWVGENEGWDGGDFHGILDALGNLGKGITEAMEVLDNHVRWGQIDDIPSTVAAPKKEVSNIPESETEAKAKREITIALESNNFEIRRAAIAELFKLSLSQDLNESLLSWLEPQAVEETAPKGELAVGEDCVTEFARDLDYMLRDNLATPVLKRHIVLGLRESAKLCGFDLTGKTFDIPTICQIIWTYSEKEESGEVPSFDTPLDLSETSKSSPQTTNETSHIAAPETEPVEQPEPSFSEQVGNHRLQTMANQFCHILKSDKVSDDTKEAFIAVLFTAGNEAGMAVQDPDLIKVAFPKIINSLEFNYGAGIVLALNALLDGFLGSEFYENELRQYEKRFESSKKPETDNTEPLANQISALLSNPELPQPIYSGLFDSLVETFNCYIDQDEINQYEKSPEHIAKILRGYKQMQPV